MQRTNRANRATRIAFVTGNNPYDQHYVRLSRTPKIVRKASKLKQAWGV